MLPISEKEVSGPMASPAHGPGGLFSNPALGRRDDKAQQTFGGTKRGDLRDSSFLDPKRRSFPVKTAQDVRDAVSSWGRYTGSMSFETFKRRLIRRARAIGALSALPASWEVSTKPFVSQAQARWAFAKKKPWAKEWAAQTDFADLPKHKAVQIAEDAHPGAMIALMLSSEQQTAITDGIPGTLAKEADHCTLIYLAEDAKDIEQYKGGLLSGLASMAGVLLPVDVTLNGYGAFAGDTEKYPLVLLLNSPQLPSLRAQVLACAVASGISIEDRHGFTPHITLSYLPADKPMPRMERKNTPLRFEAISLVWAGERIDLPLLGEVQTTKAPNYSARAGETITGNLGRGAGGQFVSAGNAQSNPKRFGKTDEEKKRAEAERKRSKRDSTADETGPKVGLSSGDLNALRQAAEGGSLDNAKLAALGLLQDGEINSAGRRALSALERGDTRAYAAAVQTAKRRMERDQAKRSATQERRAARGERRQTQDKPSKDDAQSEARADVQRRLALARAEEQRVRREVQRQQQERNAEQKQLQAELRQARVAKRRALAKRAADQKRQQQAAQREEDKRRLALDKEQAKREAAEQKKRQEEQNARDTADKVGLGTAGLEALRGVAEGGSVDPRYGAALESIGLAQRVGDSYEATNEGRRALSAVEKGDLRNWQAAMQQARARLQREANKAVTLKHGKHDQSTHGRKGRAGQAGAAAYQAARADGKTHSEALTLQKQATAAERQRMRDERRQAPLVTPKPTGDTTRAYGSDPNQHYTLQHKLVDMSDLKASNLPNGAINPAYDPALQPRDRSRAASQAQIDGVARNLNADVLVTDFHRIDSGSPIIDANGNVLSGNGRTLALQRANEFHPEVAAAYKERLRAEAERLGIDPKAIDGMQHPVLVRELKGDADPVAFAREANNSGTLRMSPLEQAKVDAQTLRDRDVLRLNVKPDQNIDQALRDPGNKAFINDFLSTVPDNERATLLTRNGDLNQMGLYRAKAALYSKAFPGESGSRLAESMLESLDPEVKTIQNGISASLPSISRAAAMIRSGERDKHLDLSEDFAKTIDVYARIKDNPHLTANTPANRLIDKYLGQSQMFDRELTPDQEVLLRHIDNISRKPSAVRDLFQAWADAVERQPPPGQSSLFGGDTMSKSDLISLLIRGSGAGATAQGSMF